MKKIFLIIAATALVLNACKVKDVDADEMFLSEEAAQAIMDAESEGYELLTINDFLDKYMTEQGNYMSEESQYRTRANNEVTNPGIYLFSIDTLPTHGKGIYIRGRVCTDDYGGNFYKAMVIQQIVEGKQQALRISIDAGNSNGMYSIGQELLIRVNGLAIGRYANEPQLCVPTYNNNIYAQHAEQKIGWAPGRIHPARFMKAVTRIGLPDKSKLQVDVLEINDFIDMLDVKDARKWDGMLVRINNIHFTGEYADTNGDRLPCTDGDPETDSNANVFGPTTLNVGYPQGRVITDGTDYTLVSTSEYAKFAYMYLPAAEYIGSVEGILSFYMDNASYSPTWKTWAITIRDLGDIKLSNSDTTWVPEEYHK